MCLSHLLLALPPCVPELTQSLLAASSAAAAAASAAAAHLWVLAEAQHLPKVCDGLLAQDLRVANVAPHHLQAVAYRGTCM
jgi:hypothetical protein